MYVCMNVGTYPLFSVVKICELMLKLLCHASRLKLRGMTHSYLACRPTECGMFIKEDLKHIVLQYPGYVDIREQMFTKLYMLDTYSGGYV